MAQDNVESQKTKISSLMSEELKKGNTWYLVASNWYKKWKKYVVYDSWDTSSTGQSSGHPGPVDNSPLLKPQSNELMEKLTHKLDYIVVPEDAWSMFVSWYGICDGQEPIARKVIEVGSVVKSCLVELYSIDLKLGFQNDLENAVICKFSGGDTIQSIEIKMRELFDIPDRTPVRLWYKVFQWVPLRSLDKTILEVGLCSGVLIIVEDGLWNDPVDKPPEKPLQIPSNMNMTEVQKIQISSLLSRKLKKGDTWYLVDSNWHKKWNKYVGYDSWDISSTGQSSVQPGPVDNSPLLKLQTNELKQNLTHKLDYVVVPEDVWGMFVSWYGISNGQEPIARKVIEVGCCQVELYLIDLKLGFQNNLENAVICKFSGGDTIQSIEIKMRELFDIPDRTPVRLWYKVFQWVPLRSLDKTILEVGLCSGVLIVVEDGLWNDPVDKPPEKPLQIPSNLNMTEVQKIQISSLLSRKLKKGDTWYLIDSNWFKKWKKYVVYDSWDISSTGQPSVQPGPVDNSPLLKPQSNELMEKLTHKLDYIVVPEDAWSMFVSWYGICDGQEPIARKVIEVGSVVKSCLVELYSIDLKLGFQNNLENAVICKFSGGDTIQSIEIKMRELFDIPDRTPVRLWYKVFQWVPLRSLDKTILEVGLCSGVLIIVEDGLWNEFNEKLPEKPLQIPSNINVTETQKIQISSLMSRALNKGDTWYLVESNWYKKWKTYVGYDLQGTSTNKDVCAQPGLIDNSPLMKPQTNELQEKLAEVRDYVLVPEEAWGLFKSWYGIYDGQEPIARKVIETCFFGKHCKVEVHLMNLKLSSMDNQENTALNRFSRADTIQSIEMRMREMFNIDESTPVHLWRKNIFRMEPLNKPDSTVQDTGLCEREIILIEAQNHDGSWCVPQNKQKLFPESTEQFSFSRSEVPATTSASLFSFSSTEASAASNSALPASTGTAQFSFGNAFSFGSSTQTAIPTKHDKNVVSDEEVTKPKLNVVDPSEEMITCIICFNVMIDPQMLPCQHTFCDRCIKQLANVTLNQKQGIQCPTCRQFCHRNDIQSSLIVKKMIEFNLQQKNATDERYCKLHPSYKIEARCIPCDTDICAKCKFDDHDVHPSESYNAAIKKIQPQVSDKMSSISTYIQDIESSISSLQEKKKSIEMDAERMKSQFKTQCDKLMADVDRSRKSAEKEINSKIELLQSNANSHRQFISSRQKTIGESENAGLLKVLQAAEKECDQIREHIGKKATLNLIEVSLEKCECDSKCLTGRIEESTVAMEITKVD